MTREEAIDVLKDILEEATSDEDAVCYVTSEDVKAFNMAIESLSAEYEDYEHATLVDIKEPLKVAVVRCKYCRHAEHRKQMPDQIYCKRDKLSTFCAVHDDDDFCKFGERR